MNKAQVKGVVGQAILPADRLSSLSSRLKRRPVRDWAKPLVCVALAVLSIGLAGCSSAPEPASAPAAPKAAPEPAHVPDHTSLFPPAGQVSAKVVPDHLLDMKALPGGSLAEYDVKGKKYQMFIIDTDSNQKAAFLMLDMKGEMKNTEYLAHMGGYYGTYGDQPLYTFAKLHFVAGIVGLPRDKADPIAIKLAAQLD